MTPSSCTTLRADLIREDQLRHAYERDGYCWTPLLNQDEVTQLLDLYRTASPGMPGGFYTTLWSDDRDYRRRVHESFQRVMMPALARVLNPGRMVLCQFAVKHANREDSEFPMHQDWAFVDETKYWPVNVWCPLVDVDLNNGCLAFVPGSHVSSTDIRPNAPREYHAWPFDNIMPLLKEKYLRELPMRAGEAILYDGRLVHGSRPNRTPNDRPVLVAVVIPQEAPLQHYWQKSPDTIEVFDVDDDFYWREVSWGSRPEGRPVADVISVSSEVVPLTEEDYLSAWQQRGGEPLARTNQ